jgi:hypothetical protein
MPVRTRLNAAPSVRIDAVSAFKWSNGDGLSHDLDYPHFKTRAAAEKAWQRVRRAVWATTHRFTVPPPAIVYDGLTSTACDAVLDSWNADGAFDLAGALNALAADRANLAAFERTKAARSISDYLALFREDLDTIEQTARELDTVSDGDLIRPYPRHLHTGAVYGL